jgi:hypothetical protein
VIGVEAVWAPADAVLERYRALILLATFGSLRWGERAALIHQHRTMTRDRAIAEAFGRSNRAGPVMTLGTFWARSGTAHHCSITTLGAAIRADPGQMLWSGVTRIDSHDSL